MPEPWITERLGDESLPRPGFEHELGEQLTAAWRGEPIVGGAPATVRRSRRRWPAAVWLGAAAVLVLGIVLVVRGRDGHSRPIAPTPTTAPSPTVAASTTRPSIVSSTVVPATSLLPATTVVGPTSVASAPTTVAPPSTQVATTLPASTTTVAGSGQPGFDPPCVEQPAAGATAGGVAAGAPGESGLDALGPLPSVPTIQVSLPSTIGDDGSSDIPTVRPQRIPGGVLLSVGASPYTPFAGSMLAAIDATGTTRWVRCMSGTVSGTFVGPASASPTKALVAVTGTTGTAGTGRTDWLVLSLADGSTHPLADDLAGQGVAAPTTYPLVQGTDQVVFGPGDEHVVNAKKDTLLRIELTTLQAGTIPVPPSAGGQQMYLTRLDVDATDRLVVTGSTSAIHTAVFADGAWSSDPDVVRRDQPPTVDFAYGPAGAITPPLSAVDATGAVVWQDDDIVDLGGEGFRTAPSGDVTVVSGCFAAFDPTKEACPQPGVAGIRTADGSVVWRLAGRGVGPVADGFAIMTEESPPAADGSTTFEWVMVDTTDGSLVAGQRWTDPSTFESQCCGGGDFVFVHRDGGVVVGVNNQRVEIWYPKASGLGSHAVSLP